MRNMKQAPNGGMAPAGVPAPQKQKKRGGAVGRFFRRFFLCFFTLIILLLIALVLVLNMVFNGPSESARAVLTMSLTEASATKWVPGLFMDKEVVEEIRKKATDTLPDQVSNTDQIVINHNSSAAEDIFAGHPDGIVIEEVKGKTYNAHVMLVRDPSLVYMATSLDDENGNLPEGAQFSTSKEGSRINQQIAYEGAVAAVNAGAFNDDGTANSTVGSVPAGLVMRDGKVLSNTAHEFLPKDTPTGFAGFNKDDVLVVAKSMTPEQAVEQNIRDGCQFGPVLIMNGVINEEAYNSNSGYNPRTVVGQRADGVVIFLCIDGRQAGSLGGTYRDATDIMVEYGAVNACNMDGGSSSVMFYHDSQGLYGPAGEYTMINNYSLFQAEPRRMPNFWMVRPAE